MPKPSPVPSALSWMDRATIALWRHGLTPLFERMQSMGAPWGEVEERRYGALKDEVMDVLPPSPGVERRLPVVFVHGGGWIAGSKGRPYHRGLLGLSRAGHPVFGLNYPLAPEWPHPQALRSILQALGYLFRNGMASLVHLMGDSAGGNLATLAGLLVANPSLRTGLGRDGEGPLPKVASLVSLYGVLDRFSWVEDGFPNARLFLQAYGGEFALDPHWVPSVPLMPMEISGKVQVPPIFLAVGTRDRLARSSRLYADHLVSQGARVTYEVYPGAGHGFYCRRRPQGEALRRDVVEFLRRTEASLG